MSTADDPHAIVATLLGAMPSGSHEQVVRFFPDMDLVAPGLVRAEEWRPDPGTADAGKSALWCAVGRKR